MKYSKPVFIITVIFLIFIYNCISLAQQLNPDAVFPIPNIFSSLKQGEVSLFTGDVNYDVPLSSIEETNISYTLSIFYNSRSAYLNNYNRGYYNNAVGGYGWKLLDYPKLVKNGNTYLLLDGLRTYPLMQTSSSGNSYTYSPEADYYLWRVTRTGSGTASDKWVITTGEGDNFIFNNGAYTDNNNLIWNFSSKAGPQWGDSIQFSYNGKNLNYMCNNRGDTTFLSYQTINGYTTLTNINEHHQGMLYESVSFSYSPIVISSVTYYILSGISKTSVIAPGISTQLSPGFLFSYLTNASYNTGAIRSISDPSGKITSFTYIEGTINDRMIVYPVAEYAVNNGYINNSGDTLDANVYTAFWYYFDNAEWDSTRTYAQYNDVEVFPGGRYNSVEQDEKQPYGDNEYYFFNGNSTSQLTDLPAGYNNSVVTNIQLRGKTYLTKSNNDTLVHVQDNEKSSLTCYWGIGQIQGTASYPQLQKIYNNIFGVGSWRTYGYNSTGLVSSIYYLRQNPKPNNTYLQQTDSVIDVTVYAFEQYPALNSSGLNVLTPVCKTFQAVYNTAASLWDTTLCNATQWTTWNAGGLPDPVTGKWAEWRNLSMIDSTANTFDAFSFQPNPQWWLISNQVLSRNQSGTQTGMLRADSIPVYTVYSNESYGNYSIASFINSNPYRNESFYYGFEDYENITLPPLSSALIDSANSHTGNRSLNVSDMTYLLNSPSATQYYIFSFWMKTDDVLPTVIVAQSGDSILGTLTINPTFGKWIYAELPVMPLPETVQQALTIRIYHPGTMLYVDDIRYSPVNYDFAANIYDAGNELLTAQIGTNGETYRTIYDRFRNSIGNTGPDTAGNVRNLSVFYNSISGNYIFNNSYAFDTSQPNMILKAVAITGGIWENFERSVSKYFPPQNLVNMSVQNGLLYASGSPSNPSEATADYYFSGSHNYVLYIDIITNNLSQNQYAGLSVGGKNRGQNFTLNIVLSKTSFKIVDSLTGIVYDSLRISNVPQTVSLLVEINNGNHLFIYANGAFLFDYMAYPEGLTNPPAIISTNPGSYFDNFIVIVDPQISKTTYDASYNSMQGMIRRNSNEIVLYENMYGGPLNLNSAVTRTTLLNNGNLPDNDEPGLTYLSNFANYNPVNQDLDSSSIIVQQYGYSNPYSFSKIYDKSPMLLTEATGTGGEFSADSNGTKYQYSANSGDSLGYPVNSLVKLSVKNPDNLNNLSLKNPVGGIFADLNSTTGDTITEQYQYDQSMRMDVKYQPNYFPSGLNNKNFYIQSGYNFNGNLTSYRSPDAGTKQFIYSSTGILRYMADSNGMALNPNRILYFDYDTLGRPVESGFFYDNWTQAVLQQYASASSYIDPVSSQYKIWKKRLYYNGNNTSPNIGHLTKVMINNGNNDTIADVIENFSYDIYGNIAQTSLQVTDYDTNTYNVLYEYDLLGNVTSIDYGNGTKVVYTYNNLGQITGIGTPSNPEFYASYSYTDTLVFENLNNNSINRLYDLNPAGWIDKIQDNFFTDSLTYTQGGLDGSGYYTGLIASSTSKFNWVGAPANYTFKYKYDAFGRLIAGYVVETDSNDLNYATYDDNNNIKVLQRWEDKTVFWNSLSSNEDVISTSRIISLDNVSTVNNTNFDIFGMALDPIHGNIYWMNQQLKVFKAGIDGSNPVALPLVLTNIPQGIALDLLNNKMYIANPQLGVIIRANLDGTNSTFVVANQFPQNIAVDPNGGKIYWPDGNTKKPGSQITIKSAELDGSNIQTLITFPQGTKTIFGFDIDTLRDKIYWAMDTIIQNSHMDGTNIATVYNRGNSIGQISLDIFNKQVFWCEQNTGKIRQVNFDGTSATDVKTGLSSPEWICQNLMTNIYGYGNGTNQVSGTEGKTGQYTYDGNGNTTQSVPLGLNSISYDPMTQLTSAITTQYKNISFCYGSFNQRVFKSNNDSSTLYINGINPSPLRQKIKVPYETEREITYIYGPNGLICYNYAGDNYFILKDHLRSSRVVVNSSNRVWSYFNYSSFGDFMNDVSNNVRSTPLRYLYTGQEFDDETGLYNYNARMYSPSLGRFYSADVSSQYASPYVYVGNNPIAFNDPDGKWGFFSVLGTIVGAAGEVVGAGLAFTGVGAPAALVVIGVSSLLLTSSVAEGMSTGNSPPKSTENHTEYSNLSHEKLLKIYDKIEDLKSRGNITRQELGLNDNDIFHVDLGGLGKVNYGAPAGWDNSISINIQGAERNKLVLIGDWENLPFAANTVDVISMQAGYLYDKNSREIIRTIRPCGKIIFGYSGQDEIGELAENIRKALNGKYLKQTSSFAAEQYIIQVPCGHKHDEL